jgi:hypothetical protein
MYDGNEDAFDIDHCVNIGKPHEYIFKMFPVLIRNWEIQTHIGFALHKIAYTMYNVPWFLE